MLSQKIKDKAIELGYLKCGIIPTNMFEEYTQSLDSRVKSFPESKELYEYFYNFSKQPEGAKSVIVCTQRFNNYKPVKSLDGLIAKCYQFDCRLAYTNEYRMGIEFVEFLKILGINVFKDATVPDRWAAAKAGLGKFGRNNFIYDKDHGSNIWIETWVIDKELEYDVVNDDIHLSDCDEGCSKCISSCPTNALSDELSMDMGKCITYLFCHGDAAPDAELSKQMGRWIYGCDICQDVCPHNQDKYNESDEFPLLAEFSEFLTLESILDMDEDTYKNIVNPRFWYAGEDGLWLWKRNAKRAIENSVLK